MSLIREIRDFLIFGIAILVIFLATISIIGRCSSLAYADTKTWEEKQDKEKFKSAKEGIVAGRGWCLYKSSKCSKSIPKRLEKRMEEYGPWFEKYAGGLIPAHIALTSCTEAPSGPNQCSPDSKLKECGLLGIKLTQAKDCSINVCDPEASAWCAARGGNARRIAMFEKYPALKLAPSKDQYLIGGMAGGIGNIIVTIIEKSGALDTVGKNGATELKYESPYKRLLQWYGSSKAKPSTLVEKIMIGRLSSYKIGFRIARGEAVIQHVMNYYGVKEFNDIPRGKLQIIPRPEHFDLYPGDKNHGKCNKYPELLAKKPNEQE